MSNKIFKIAILIIPLMVIICMIIIPLLSGDEISEYIIFVIIFQLIASGSILICYYAKKYEKFYFFITQLIKYFGLVILALVIISFYRNFAVGYIPPTFYLFLFICVTYFLMGYVFQKKEYQKLNLLERVSYSLFGSTFSLIIPLTGMIIWFKYSCHDAGCAMGFGIFYLIVCIIILTILGIALLLYLISFLKQKISRQKY